MGWPGSQREQHSAGFWQKSTELLGCFWFSSLNRGVGAWHFRTTPWLPAQGGLEKCGVSPALCRSMVGQGIRVPTRQVQHTGCQSDVLEAGEISEEAAGAGEPSQRLFNIQLAGAQESQALCPAVTELHKDVVWPPGWSVLVGSSVDMCCQPARVLGSQPGPFLCPCTCKSSAFQSRSHVLVGSSSPWRPMSNVGCLRLLERGGLGGLPVLLHAWQWVR